jgi:TolB protein
MAGGPVEITASYEGVAARTALVVDPRAATDLLVMESWRATTTSLWGPEVWRTASDGSGARALTPGVVGYRPSWSPDRRRVIFARQPEPNAQFDLWSVNADGTDLRPVRLTPATSENFPKYSPDGRSIAFVASTGDRTELMVANADGTNPRVIASDASAEGGIDWTPDGTRLIYVRFDQSQRSSLVSIAPDGTNRTLLPVPWNVPQGQEFPSVSPDGREIAFAVPVPGESRNVLVMRLDGTDVRVVAGGAGLQATPTWSPDGQWIAYTNVPGEQGYLVYKVRRDGTGATPITPLPPAGVRLLDLFPQWR